MPHQEVPKGWLSVTQVLALTIDKPYLRFWYGKYGTAKCNQIAKESQEIGTEVHGIIESRLNATASILIARNERQQSITMADNFWNQFKLPYNVKPKELELTLQDEKLKLQGTFDAVIDTNKWKNVTADWKTSNSLDKVSVPLQLSMYDYLRKGNGKGVVVRIDKESDVVEVQWYEDLKQYEPIWKSALTLARFIKFGLEG